jgi:hypothetical protein
MNSKAKAYIFSIPASAAILLPLYIIAHEFGHALIALLCSARITQFNILHAYISYEGGSFTSFTSSLLNAAGMLLPVLLSAVFMLFYRREKESVFYRVFSFFLAVMPAFSILAWVIVPITYLAGSAPAGDDVTQFLDHSGFSPLLVLFAALLLFAACVALALKKGILSNFRQTVKDIRVNRSHKTPQETDAD